MTGEYVPSVIKNILNDPALTPIETLQALWSGYGDISRFYSPKLGCAVVAKSVTPPNEVNHPRGWHSDVGHKRKLQSYKIEAHFYQHFAQRCDEHCYVPQFIALNESCSVEDAQQILVMEDLQAAGFDDDNSELSLDDIKVVIRWLAYFHACFMQEPSSALWSIGTYWHLATRQDEYQVMENSPLKHAAQFIDNTLNNAQYQTLVHGDAKLANFCFGVFEETHKEQLISTAAVKRVAAVDFQYVGHGVGVKDLAYFLGSCLCDDDLTALHNELLFYYFSELEKGLQHYGKQIDFTAVEQEWRTLYGFACADFHRFLLGWSPEHPKINGYLQQQTQQVLAGLNNSISQ